MGAIVPTSPVRVRAATLADVPFMDALQKMHSKQVGWMPTKQFEGKIAAGNVLIAEEKFGVGSLAFGVEAHASELQTPNTKLQTTQPLGYCIGVDRYFKRDDVGIIYQMNVAPGKQRGFVGASLLQAQFDRSAYGCRLYCCWCAQDIQANRFWEAMGFVALAFRAGSEKKGPKGQARTHIFWQKRIRAGDETTPWWFPSKTDAGALREDRIVLPIPPGVHWSDAMPSILPAGEREQIEDKATRTSRAKPKPTPAPAPKRMGMQFAPPGARVPPPIEEAPPTPVVAPPKPKRPAKKCDPRLIAAARELRDRWLEQINSGEHVPQITAKYDVRREVSALRKVEAIDAVPIQLLEAA